MGSDLDGKQVVVTGGTGELGRAVVVALLEAGATCHVPQRGPAPPPDMPANPRLRFTGGVDLIDEAAVKSFYARLPSLWASVHTAGGFAAAALADTSLSAFRFQMDLNLVTSFLCCREAARKMGTDGGRIINVASRAALQPRGGTIAYSVAKAGVVSLTQCLADELTARRIAVNAIVPSTIDTPANRRAMPDADFSKWPSPAALADAIVALCRPEAALISGALIAVYGEA